MLLLLLLLLLLLESVGAPNTSSTYKENINKTSTSQKIRTNSSKLALLALRGVNFDLLEVPNALLLFACFWSFSNSFDNRNLGTFSNSLETFSIVLTFRRQRFFSGRQGYYLVQQGLRCKRQRQQRIGWDQIVIVNARSRTATKMKKTNVCCLQVLNNT